MKKIVYSIVSVLLFAACSKDDATGTVDPVISVTVTNLPADTIIGITPGAPPAVASAESWLRSEPPRWRWFLGHPRRTLAQPLP
jgi:hypothetical protein